jgi:hypothetical protein
MTALASQDVYPDLNQGRLPYQESSRASDVLRLIVELPELSVNVHRCPLAVAPIVTQLVTRRGRRPPARLTAPSANR